MQKIRKEKWLFVAPWSIPITGQSVVSEHVLSILESECVVAKVNTNGRNRYFKTLRIIGEICSAIILSPGNKNIYFTVSRSIFGSLKDVVLLLLSGSKVNHIFCHVHGSDLVDFLENKSYYTRSILVPLMQKVDVFIVTHDIYRGELQSIFPKSKVVTILNFVS